MQLLHHLREVVLRRGAVRAGVLLVDAVVRQAAGQSRAGPLVWDPWDSSPSGFGVGSAYPKLQPPQLLSWNQRKVGLRLAVSQDSSSSSSSIAVWNVFVASSRLRVGGILEVGAPRRENGLRHSAKFFSEFQGAMNIFSCWWWQSNKFFYRRDEVKNNILYIFFIRVAVSLSLGVTILLVHT